MSILIEEKFVSLLDQVVIAAVEDLYVSREQNDNCAKEDRNDGVECIARSIKPIVVYHIES